jgi:preprotein translocase subunit SecA
VLNDQRYVIFSQRKDAMKSDKIFQYSIDFLNEIIESLIPLKILKKSNPKSSDFDNKIKGILGKNFLESDLKKLNECSDKELREILNIKFKESRDERIKLLGEEQAKDIEKRIFLQSIDINWKSHIQYLEQLRQVVGLRSYGQRDPLVEYKKEAFYLFENLLNKLKLDFITILMNLKIVQESPPIEKTKINSNDPKCLLILHKDRKISRNEKCEATGKKFKNCCGAL